VPAGGDPTPSRHQSCNGRVRRVASLSLNGNAPRGSRPARETGIVMSWRDNDLALEALAVQGYYDEEHKILQQDILANSLRDVFLRKPVKASAADVLDKKSKFFHAGLTKADILDRILPSFREKHQLNDEERLRLRKNSKDHPDLEERDKAVNEVGTLLWGTLGKTSRSGAVQALLVQRGLLLVEAKGVRNGAPVVVKAATDDQDLIIEFYVRPRGDQLVRVSGGVRDDCTMVGMTFDGIAERMKRELGISVTTAVTRLLQVATPDLAALNTGVTNPAKAIPAGPTKG